MRRDTLSALLWLGGLSGSGVAAALDGWLGWVLYMAPLIYGYYSGFLEGSFPPCEDAEPPTK